MNHRQIWNWIGSESILHHKISLLVDQRWQTIEGKQSYMNIIANKKTPHWEKPCLGLRIKKLHVQIMWMLDIMCDIEVEQCQQWYNVCINEFHKNQWKIKTQTSALNDLASGARHLSWNFLPRNVSLSKSSSQIASDESRRAPQFIGRQFRERERESPFLLLLENILILRKTGAAFCCDSSTTLLSGTNERVRYKQMSLGLFYSWWDWLRLQLKRKRIMVLRETRRHYPPLIWFFFNILNSYPYGSDNYGVCLDIRKTLNYWVKKVIFCT